MNSCKRAALSRPNTRYKTRFGTEFAVETVLQRVVHDGREFILLLARDVGTRKQAESDLSESAERFRALFDESPVAALLLDSEFRLIGVNRPRAKRSLRRRRAVGKDPTTLLHVDDRPLLQHARAEMQRGAVESESAERRFMHRDGRVVWTKLSMRAIASESGLRHTLLVLENFTDRKIFEEQLQVALRDQQTLFEDYVGRRGADDVGKDSAGQPRIRGDVRLQRRRSHRHAVVGPVH
jgi:PAS domain S-box-containing protein